MLSDPDQQLASIQQHLILFVCIWFVYSFQSNFEIRFHVWWIIIFSGMKSWGKNTLFVVSKIALAVQTPNRNIEFLASLLQSIRSPGIRSVKSYKGWERCKNIYCQPANCKIKQSYHVMCFNIGLRKWSEDLSINSELQYFSNK